ncbi:Protein BIM1 [Cyberlindnera fabianii]|uniref:Protein BIM1 n=1 Tax=Cyberlindnera fabianii TaxID=36022 RepID=A0A1V2LDU0_CYBFA|nr:Protein BIM1 [Cyberlindnera fabianii]
MAESRMELLNWVNTTLDLNYTKVEQLGTGAAYCQLMDSIFLDVAMKKVKFDATKEYEYLNNYKVLQACFLKHKINKTIPVERLVKCRFQDNLEFFQWIRKFWKDNKDESEYDPNARRKYLPPPVSSTPAPRSTKNIASTPNVASSSRRSTSASSTSSNALPRSRTASLNSVPSKPTSRVSSINNTVNKELEQELHATKEQLTIADTELEEYRVAVEALETERNFYFNKLREIEILTETTSELLKEAPANNEEQPTLKEILLKIQEVLYSTEEGFQVPDETMEMDEPEAKEIIMEETF